MGHSRKHCADCSAADDSAYAHDAKPDTVSKVSHGLVELNGNRQHYR
jgi:hypothetical protein